MAKRIYFKYGMRLRGFAPMCQPLDGLYSVEDGKDGYYNILKYKRPLTDKEQHDYELDDLNDYKIKSKSKIQERRMKLGWTAEVLAEKSGVQKRTIDRYEQQGVMKASVENILKIADALGVTILDII